MAVWLFITPHLGDHQNPRDTIHEILDCCNASPSQYSLLQWWIAFARVVKSVDTTDLKSVAFRKGRAGSIPASGTSYWSRTQRKPM